MLEPPQFILGDFNMHDLKKQNDFLVENLTELSTGYRTMIRVIFSDNQEAQFKNEYKLILQPRKNRFYYS